jgi:hypothetical protein
MVYNPKSSLMGSGTARVQGSPAMKSSSGYGANGGG